MSLNVAEIDYKRVYTSPSLKGYVLGVGLCKRSRAPRGANFYEADAPQVFDIHVNGNRAATFVISMYPTLVDLTYVCQPVTKLSLTTNADLCYALCFTTPYFPDIVMCVYVGYVIDPVTASYKTVHTSKSRKCSISDHRGRLIHVANILFRAHPLPEPTVLTPTSSPSLVLTPVNTPPTSPPPLKMLHTNDSPIREPPRLRYPPRAFCFYPNTPTTSETSESDPGSPAVRELKATTESAQHNVVTLLNGLEQRLTERMDVLEQKLEATQAK